MTIDDLPQMQSSKSDAASTFRGGGSLHHRRFHMPKYLQVKDDESGRGFMTRDVFVDSPKVLPVIEILSARYGHPRNSVKTLDICTQLRAMIEAQVIKSTPECLMSGARPQRPSREDNDMASGSFRLSCATMGQLTPRCRAERWYLKPPHFSGHGGGNQARRS